jgi:hypothetical protein
VWLAVGCVLALIGFLTWTHGRQVAESVAVPQGPVADVNTESSQAGEAKGMVRITGPLADSNSRWSPGQAQTAQPGDSASSSTTPSYKPTQMDLAGDTPVGTSVAILHTTFAVAALVNLPFDIPPHAANPQLHGTYRSFLPKGVVAADETSADVEFLLLNQQQYDTLLSGHASEAVLSVEDAHNQEVNTALAPTFDQPVRYYLVFRNNSRAKGRKLVQADFRVDF